MAALFNCGIVVNNSQPVFLDTSGIGTMLTTPSPGSYSQEDTSSNMSTRSSSSSPFGNLTYLAPEQDASRPYLRIMEQPVEKFRFRYKSEMMGTHGSILGRNADRVRKRTYPTVELCNYEGEAVVRCSLYTADPDESMRTPHTHRLIVRVDNDDKDDPHEVTVSPEQGYVAVFQGMGIIHTAKKHITDELVKKKRLRLLETLKLINNNIKVLSQRNELDIRAEAEQEAKRMNLNVVTLKFEALARKNGTLIPICDQPVYSQPINNMKSALTGELKICRIDKYTSSCLGNEEVFILVEKVGKKNIKVKFYELDDEENEIWCDYGKFSELDVHHQYAIVFRTPPYRDTNIDKQVDVFVQLYRPTDGDCSDPIRFVYKPSEMSGRTRKRARTSLTEEIPTAVVTGTVNHNPVLAQSNGIGTNGAISSLLLNDLDAIPTPPSFFEEVLNESDTNAADFEDFMKNLSLPSLSSAYCSSYDEADGPIKNENGMKDGNMMHICTDGVGNFSLKYRKPGTGSLRSEDAKRAANRKAVTVPETRSKAPPPRRELDPERFAKRAIARLTEILSENPSTDVIVKNVIEIFSTRTQKDDNPIHCSVIYEQKSLLRQMLPILAKGSHYGIINAHNGVGLTPLHLAVLQNQADYVRLLIKNEADPRIGTLKEGRTAVHLAVEEGRDTCLSVLLSSCNYPSADKFPDCNALDDSGNAPIHVAARKGNLLAVKKLLEMGCANINVKDKSHGRTVLHIAIEEMNATFAEYLLEKTKIVVDETDYDGNTALHLACVVGDKGSVELCRLLLKYQANPHKTNLVMKDRREREREGLDKELVEVKMEPDSEDDDDDYQLKIESEDEDEDPLESRGQSSFDLASENKEIMDLLLLNATKQEDANITVKEEPMEVPILDDILGEVKNGLFDEQTLAEISLLLDKSGRWSRLAERLDYGFLSSSIRNASSPTRMLLNYADLQGLSSIQDIRKHLKDLSENRAVEALDRMLVKMKK